MHRSIHDSRDAGDGLVVVGIGYAHLVGLLIASIEPDITTISPPDYQASAISYLVVIEHRAAEPHIRVEHTNYAAYLAGDTEPLYLTRPDVTLWMTDLDNLILFVDMLLKELRLQIIVQHVELDTSILVVMSEAVYKRR